VVSTVTHSLFSHRPKRGIEGFEVAKVLPTYQGMLVHDFWSPYNTIPCDHSRCNAHLLRELKAFIEAGHHWAEQITTTLLEMKKAADEARQKGIQEIAAAHRKRLAASYDKWVRIGLEAHPEKTKPPGKRGRIGQSKETNLLRRLRDKREEVLRFMNDLLVPFDNNQAERDLRMIKVQQKVSGCFRSEEGARRFCEISSYISTVRKQGINLMNSIKAAFTGDPVKLTT
jgi:transposase